MSKIIEQIISEVEKFNESIIDVLDSKNISNTREAANSLRIEFGEDFVQSIGVFYLEFLDTGRGPGIMPPYEPIANWVNTKLGIDENDETFEGVVFAIRKKIADMGTEIFRNNSKGIELREKIITLRENIMKTTPKFVVSEIKQHLNKFKKIYNEKL
jgi:hypothetical protein